MGAVSTYTFTNTAADHTISATFAVNTYTITATSGANGSVTPAGVTTVNCDGSQSYTITADACYHIADVLVDGVSVGAVTSYTFNNVTANHTISVTFTVNTYTIIASAGPNGSIAPTGTATVNCGSDNTYTITADACYHVADVLVEVAFGRCSCNLYIYQHNHQSHDQRNLCGQHIYDHSNIRSKWFSNTGRCYNG
ncbi:MAG: hypothetical protein IPP96_14130 [Chitinophagaceae bacterium]|nr:hypothetical protein [Chitinophagaceae bacterium]